ncbi:50S ribosomal protein L7ae [Lysinibacillus alkalisoli]|uniref:50S ribosomal protein L7ae n=1 Tax=Lysinibacillus alkalisoli TaxID=1911548 RepID=A0A917G420_9BACI|nr:YlxQ family RNA-binding protein [Lysinibacillus alkalisoli]GGG22108.1 50S ribosomal protein L7ae [Lysinibacillus alkalisoli]
MNEQAVLNLLGIAARARKVTSGEELVVKDIRSGHAKIVILSEDASHNTTKKITDKCKYYNVEYHVFSNRYDLGHATGKEARVALAIKDKGFAQKLSSLLNEK